MDMRSNALAIARILQNNVSVTLLKRTSGDTFSSGETYVNCEKKALSLYGKEITGYNLLGGFGVIKQAQFCLVKIDETTEPTKGDRITDAEGTWDITDVNSKQANQVFFCNATLQLSDT